MSSNGQGSSRSRGGFQSHNRNAKLRGFSKLPPEIRRAIWEAALPPPNICQPVGGSQAHWDWENDKPTQFIKTWKPPLLREACREAYQVTMSVGRFRFGYFQDSGIRGLWFNEEIDAVYISRERQLSHNHFPDVRTFYLSAELALDSVSCRRFVESSDFDSCRRLVIAMDPKGSMGLKMMRQTTSTFLKMQDHDRLGRNEFDETDYPAGGQQHITLSQARDVILKFFQNRQRGAKGSLKVEAVEVFRK